jgi:hypothetical protein
MQERNVWIMAMVIIAAANTVLLVLNYETVKDIRHGLLGAVISGMEADTQRYKDLFDSLYEVVE